MSSTAHSLLDKRNNPEYINFLAVGEALNILCNGLRLYAEKKMKEFYNLLMPKLCGISCNCSYTPGVKLNPHNNPKTSTCIWAKELRNYHCNAFIPWYQSDSHKWHDPVDGYWEIAKIFMSNLGKKWSDVKNPSKTDLTALLNLMINCKHFNVRKDLLESVKDWRNYGAHSPDTFISEPDKQSAFQAINDLINDVELKSSKEVQQCLPAIQNVQVADVAILEEKELKILKEFRLIKELNKWEKENSVPASMMQEEDSNDSSSRKRVCRGNIPIAILLSFLTFIMKTSSRYLWWILLIFSFVQIGKESDVLLDNGCSRYVKESPISHFHFQEFDFSSYLAYKREHFFGRKWFFDKLEDIFETGRSPAGVLITGEPGSGKSALISQLICSPYSSLFIHNNIIGYHLCDYSETGKRDGARFVRNLVDQISRSISEYSEHVANNEQLQRELDKRCDSDPTGCFFSTIVGPLRELKNEPDSLRYIVLDALDECLEEDVQTSAILNIINNKLSHFPKWLKVILTSRNLTAVTTKIPRTVKRMALDTTDERNVEDIRRYIKIFFRKNTFFMDRLLEAKLTESGEGNFLYVKKTLEYMIESDGRINIESFPTSLYDMYKAYFKRYFGKHDFNRFKGLFEVLLAAGSPLHFNEIDSILKLQNQTQDILKLVEQVSFFMRYGQNGTVKIYHQSFAEWLVNQTNDADGFSICKSQGHRYIVDFLLDGIRKRNANPTFKELSELSMHVLSGGMMERHQQTLQLLNVSEIRDPHYNRSILHDLAMKEGSRPLLEIFLPKFVSADIPDMEGKTPAFHAASEGILENLNFFVDRGADVNYVHDNFPKSVDPILTLGQTDNGIEEISMIHIAAYNGHAKIVELLIQSNFSLVKPRRNVPTPLHLAAGNGHLEVVKLLCNSGVKADIISLHHAAARNHSAVVMFLVKTTGVVDECLPCKQKNFAFSQNVTVEEFHASFCETALYAAVSRRHFGIVRLLLSFSKAALECKHHSGKTPLMEAVERNDFEMVDLLLSAGANVESECGDEMSEDLIKQMCSVFLPNENELFYTVYCEKAYCTCGSKVLHLCGRYGLWKMAVYLTLEWNANILEQNCNGDYPSFIAIYFDQAEFIDHIGVTLVGRSDEIIVELAAACGSTKILKLFSRNPDLFALATTKNNITLLSSAVFWSPYPSNVTFTFCPQVLEANAGSLIEKRNDESRKRIAAVKFMAESQKNISVFLNMKNKDGRAALHYAALNGFAGAVQYLVEHGSNVNLRDKQGNTPLDLALEMSPTYPHVISNCYDTIDGLFTVCNTTSYDETAGYLIWSQRSNIKICDSESSKFLKAVIEKQMPLSFYNLLKIGVDKNCEVGQDRRPFLNHLKVGGEQISEVFKIFNIDVSVECGVPFRESELHLMAYSSVTGNIGNFFKPASVNNLPFPLQRLIKNHPKGIRIFHECRDEEGYLATHRAAQGGNIDAINWFISIGADMLKKTSSGLTVPDLFLSYLKPTSPSKTFPAPSIPLTNTNYRRDTFEKLLVQFFMTAKHERLTFQCDSKFEAISPLHIAALRGVNMLRLVYKKAREILPSLPLNCTNKHWILPRYLAYFRESIEEIRNNPSGPLQNTDYYSDGAILQYPDRDAEYHIIYNYFYNSPNEFKKHLYQQVILSDNPFEISECPGFYDLLPKRNTLDKIVASCTNLFHEIEFTDQATDEKSMTVQLPQEHCHCCYIFLDPQISPFASFFHECHCAFTMHKLQQLFTEQPKKNRQVSPFIAERMSWKDTSADGDVRDRWPFYFFYKKVMNEYKSYKYLEILNEALELNHGYDYDVNNVKRTKRNNKIFG